MMSQEPKAVTAENKPSGIGHDEIKRALIEYCHFPHSQGFAIMLNGAWGSGKTRFIKNCAENLARERPGETRLKPLYVSLYGVRDSSEIDDLLFQQLHPILSHKATRLAGAVFRGLGKFALKVDLGPITQINGSLPETNLSSMLTGADGRVIIFDDLERALIPPAAILGYINPFIEHEDCKVIIIADESRLDDDYGDRKEKTIGQTFQFDPDVSSAYASFLEEIDTESARTFLTLSENAIAEVFADSQLSNLRLLKQLLWDFERLWNALTSEQQAHHAATQELLTLLCAAALELRSNRLNEDDFTLPDPFRSAYSSTRNQIKSTSNPMEGLKKRYPTVQFDSAIVDETTICDCVLRSRVSKENVQTQLKRHPYFADRQEDVPSWRALWTSFEISPEKQDAIVSRFEEDFEARRFDDRGAIYHVIGLSLWLAKLGYPNWPVADIEDKIKLYIRDVYSIRVASLDEASEEEKLDPTMGSYGLGYREHDDPRFPPLASYEREQRTAWRMRTYPAIAEELYQLAKNDSQAFLRQVCFTSYGPAKFAGVGILKYISADQFSNMIATAAYQDQKQILLALSMRYEQVSGYTELRDELPWLKDVSNHLQSAATKLPRIAQEMLLNLKTQSLDKAISAIDRLLRDS